MKRSIVVIILLALMIVFNSKAFAQETATDEAASQPSQEAATEAIDPHEINKESEYRPSASDLVLKDIEDYFSEKDITAGSEGNNGKIYYSATAQVRKNKDSSQWAKSRALAFDEAYVKTQVKFIIDQFGKQVVTRLQGTKEDQSDDAEEFPTLDESKSKLRSIADKVVALTGAKLDKALKKEGVDPEEFKAKPKAQRKAFYIRKAVKRTLTKAIGQTTGLFPIQTFEGKDSDGNHVIGVITMYSPKVKQLTYDITHRRTPLLKKKTGTPLKELIPRDPRILAKQFGVRIVFNEKGEPCIVSYGQWGHNYSGKSSKRRERRRESARDSAFDEANAGITEFIDGNLEIEKEAVKGTLSEEAVSKSSDGFISEDGVEKVIDKKTQTLKSRAEMDLRGTNTHRVWQYKHPYGQEIIGVVRTWTLSAAEITDNIRKWKPKTRRKKAKTKSSIKTKSGVERGLDQVDKDDF